MSYVEPLMRRNFLEYASYVIVDRAIPDIADGCKPVQRRILYTLSEVDDGRFHKVANIIGESMKLHPHGDASIGDALVVLANKEYFIEKQGNFGNIQTGHPAAAPRYIECRLTPLARETLFNKHLTAFQPSYDGRKDEPIALPVKLPVVLLIGAEGIAVGMSTKILPHNFRELLQGQIRVLQGESPTLYPDFLQGGVLDASEYDDGRGRVRVRARLEIDKDQKHITIREIPYSTTTESLIASVETAVQKGKLKVSTIEDRTAEDVEIVLHLSRGVYAEEVVPQLYAYTQCAVSITTNMVVIRDGRPIELTVSEMLEDLTKLLRARIKAELEWELGQLENRQHRLTLEQIFIENRVYKRIETENTAAGVVKAVYDGMEPYKEFFVREMNDEDVERLLKIPIRRISIFDIEKNRAEIDDIVKALKTCRGKLRRLTETTVHFLEGLLERYGDSYPRRTEISSFDTVDKKAVARQTLKVGYDPETGFVGTAVKGLGEPISLSEYDKILAVTHDGTYRIFSPTDKTLLPAKADILEVFDEEEGKEITILYRDKDRNAFAKRIQIKGYIQNKEYPMIPDGAKVDRIYSDAPEYQVHLRFVPAKRQRVNEAYFDLMGLGVCGLKARGSRMARKPVATVKVIKRRIETEEEPTEKKGNDPEQKDLF